MELFATVRAASCLRMPRQCPKAPSPARQLADRSWDPANGGRRKPDQTNGQKNARARARASTTTRDMEKRTWRTASHETAQPLAPQMNQGAPRRNTNLLSGFMSDSIDCVDVAWPCLAPAHPAIACACTFQNHSLQGKACDSRVRASLQSASSLSVSSPSARVRPRLMATMGLPKRCACSANRKPE